MSNAQGRIILVRTIHFLPPSPSKSRAFHPPFPPQTPRHPPRDPIADGHVGDHGVDPAGARKDARIRHVQALGAPDFPFGIDDTLLGIVAHAAGTHLVRRAEHRVRRMQTLLPDEGQPGLECRVVDARVFGAVGDRCPFEHGHAVGDGEDLGGAGHEVDFRQGQHAFEDVLLVEGAGRVGDAAPAVGGVRVDAAGVAVAREGDVSCHVFELGA